MEVKNLKLGDNVYPVHYGINMLSEFFGSMNLNFFVSNFNLGLREKIGVIYYGIREGCRRTGTPFIIEINNKSVPITKYHIGDLMEEHWQEADEFIKEFQESILLVTEKMQVSESKNEEKIAETSMMVKP